MPRRSLFEVVIGTDGSASGQAAVETAARFPWPPRSNALVVVATAGRGSTEWSPRVWGAARQGCEEVAERAVAILRRRWPRARWVCPAQPPGKAILAAARSVGAGAVVVGFRGLSALGRVLMGSVSRHVVRGASCPVLVVKGSVRRPRTFVLGVDGSDSARHAADWLARLPAPPGVRVSLVWVIEPLRMPSAGFLPASIRATLRAEADELAAEQRARAERDLEPLAIRLQRTGWKARCLVREGLPLPTLFDTARAEDADVLVVGARGAGGVTRLLLGSVAEGAVSKAPMSVLVVR
jgi:nucleotide-binding universal stress UspA family protein